MTVLIDEEMRLDGARAARPRRPFNRNDRVALLLGAILAAAMFSWGAWRVAKNILRDRAVVPGAVQADQHTH